MKIIKNLVAIAIVTSLFSCGIGSGQADVTSLETAIDSGSYAFGLDMAVKVKANLDNVNTDLFIQGYRNGMDNDSTNVLLEEKDLNTILRTFIQQQQDAKQTAKFGDVKKVGEDFLAENRTKPDVLTTESGLQYIIMKQGTGKKPQPNSDIVIHYHGTTIDGKVFDSSVDRNKPYSSKANIYIPGFNEGLLLMNQGSKFKFFIPQDLGYGSQERGALIKPFSALVFEVELLEVKN